MKAVNPCLYCPQPADSKEHPLPAALGEFEDAPLLDGRICRRCNTERLGILEEQFTRSGPEAFLRRFYGVSGRSTNNKINPFERGSAGGSRLDMRAMDTNLGVEVNMECDNGTYRQMRELIFVEQRDGGKTHHLPIRDGMTPDQLQEAARRLGVVEPYVTRATYGLEEKEWVEALIKAVWPAAGFGETKMANTHYTGFVAKIEVTDRYFRAIAKMAFHYFLTQFPQYTGSEEMFAGIRDFVFLDTKGPVSRVNDFVGRRQAPLLAPMLDPRARPDGWRGHVLGAQTKPGECLAHVQTFVSEDWPAPVYTVRLANDPTVTQARQAGHIYIYFEDGPKGKYAGKAYELQAVVVDWPTPPPAPAVT